MNTFIIVVGRNEYLRENWEQQRINLTIEVTIDQTTEIGIIFLDEDGRSTSTSFSVIIVTPPSTTQDPTTTNSAIDNSTTGESPVFIVSMMVTLVALLPNLRKQQR